MELKYIVMTIIKILISIPTVLLLNNERVNGASLMGGHLDNSNFTTSQSSSNHSVWRENQTNPSFNSNENYSYEDSPTGNENSEEIPDPSALVLPGYNLPENIFNKGKPFYLEKDPLTGKVDFNSQTYSLNNEEEYEYVDEVPNSHDIFDKANIDRKDGSIGKYSHKTSDVNQLTPNFHDFLNLPVKYNSDKYVYPLISSSYANTKVQGNTNKYNHKNVGGGVYKPTFSPTYSSNQVLDHRETYQKPFTTSTTTTTTTTTTTKPPTSTTQESKLVYLTTKTPNLMTGEFFPNYDEYTTRKSKPNEIYLTTQNVNDIYLTTKTFSVPTTTKRTLSLFEQLFGEYDELPATTTTESYNKNMPSLFQNLPTNKIKTTTEVSPLTGETDKEKNVANILSGTNMKQENLYEYEEYENLSYDTDSNSIAQTKPNKSTTWYTPPTSSSTTQVSSTTTTTEMTTKASPPTSTTTEVVQNSDFSTDFYPSMPDSTEYDLEVEGNGNFNSFSVPKVQLTTETVKTTSKVTSLPLGENHFGNHHNHNPNPIIALTHNLKEQLNSEKVKPFNHQPVPSSNNIRISPDQDMVSFVVGHHQNVANAHVETTFNNYPQEAIPFKPLNGHQNKPQTQTEFLRPFAQTYNPFQNVPEMGGSSINIQPIKTSEASLSIGVPINDNKKVPGQVVDEVLKDKEVDYAPKGTGAKIVFPSDNEPTSSSFRPDFLAAPLPNREVLQLDSKPMYHQLPSDLTPPTEQEVPSVSFERPRPPWDPRPGHFYNGRPEYSRPPRPPPVKPNGELYKRIDKLPNILPQFRPNVKAPVGPPIHHYDHMGSFKNGFMRQPLLDRPSNKPIAVFEKLVPPPPPKNLHNLRKVPMLENKLKLKNTIEDTSAKNDQYEFYPPPHPPQVAISNRRKSEEPNIETLQMLQAKHVIGISKDVNVPPPVFQTPMKGKDNTEKPLYVVYPVNSAPIKLDVIDPGKKETVVVGTRAELPLPPSKINHEFSYESIKERNEAPILKPHPKPPTFPVKSNFPYPLERPDVSVVQVGNSIDFKEDKFPINNQWNAFDDAESRIVTSGASKINYKNSNQISVTLKTFTEKPIAVAYTPTEPARRTENTERYSMPNYAGPVISEIRPGSMDKSGSEITVSAVMHTHPQSDLNLPNPIESIIKVPTYETKKPYLENHKIIDEIPMLPKLGFQAPFQASLNVDGISQGWNVVRTDEKNNIDRADVDVETTTLPLLVTTKFDISNFKPQMLSGFKPIYNYSEDDPTKTNTNSDQSRA